MRTTPEGIYAVKGATFAAVELPNIKEVRGNVSPEYAEAIANLGFLYNVDCRYSEAESLYKKALEMKRYLYEGDHQELATSINNIAWFYLNMGRYDEAEPLFKETLDMSRRLFKGDHLHLATVINNMALFYNGRGRYAEAETLYKESLEMFKRLFREIVLLVKIEFFHY